LKPNVGFPIAVAVYVAPLAGAWIETKDGIPPLDDTSVAPLAGAWIETLMDRLDITKITCRTPRGCVD